ncbi:MAG: hypothetical protein HS130_06540 [Deltaproteobacteria bacterium]|nr:hypothetical protein [Deltaproteobacteria bacterium]
MSGSRLCAVEREKNRYVPRPFAEPGIAMNKAKFNEWWSKPVIVMMPKVRLKEGHRKRRLKY